MSESPISFHTLNEDNRDIKDDFPGLFQDENTLKQVPQKKSVAKMEQETPRKSVRSKPRLKSQKDVQKQIRLFQSMYLSKYVSKGKEKRKEGG